MARAINWGLTILATTDATEGQGVTDKDVLSFARERQVRQSTAPQVELKLLKVCSRVVTI